jgi:hypothetical protein
VSHGRAAIIPASVPVLALEPPYGDRRRREGKAGRGIQRQKDMCTLNSDYKVQGKNLMCSGNFGDPAWRDARAILKSFRKNSNSVIRQILQVWAESHLTN